MVAISGNSSLRAAQRRKNAGIHEPAERSADEERDADAQQIIAADRKGEEIGREGPDGDDVGMREIDLDQHAVDEREPQCHEHVEAAEDDAVDALLQRDRQHAWDQFQPSDFHERSGSVSM